MTPEKDNELCQKFPLLYADRAGSMRTTAMCWGFDCGDGWFDLVYKLSEKLEKIIEKYQCDICGNAGKEGHKPACQWKLEGYGFPRASQVKEKFGTLRFYMTHESPEMWVAIELAEELSAKTCEVCGNEGSLRDNGWWRTLCDQCQNERVKQD